MGNPFEGLSKECTEVSGGNRNFTKMANVKDGDILAGGVYLGTGESKFGTCYDFEHEGKIYSVQSSKVLEDLMSKIKVGEKAIVVFAGKKAKVANPSETYNTYKVLRPKSNSGEDEMISTCLNDLA